MATMLPSRRARPASHSARNIATRSVICSTEASWSSSRLKPSRAARRMLSPLPAASQSGGCGRCTGAGSTTTSSKCQRRPWWLKRPSLVQARRITAIASSKRSHASSGGMQKPSNSAAR